MKMETNVDNVERHRIRGMALVSQFEEFLKDLVLEVNELQNEIKLLKYEKSVHQNEDKTTDSEIRSLQLQIKSLAEEKDLLSREVRDFRQENKSLIERLRQRDSMAEQGLQFAKSILQNHSNGKIDLNHELDEQREPKTQIKPKSQRSGHLLEVLSHYKTNKQKTVNGDTHPNHSLITTSDNSVRPDVCPTMKISSTVHSISSIKSFDNMLNESIGTTINSSSSGIDVSPNPMDLSVKVPFGQIVSVNIAFGKSPSDFWLHLKSTDVSNYFHLIQTKQNELNETRSSQLNCSDIEVGLYCAAMFSDDCWYRGQIMAIFYDDPYERNSIRLVRILYIDWGNTEDLPLSKIMRLSTDLSEPRQALHCHLQGFLEDHIWSDKSIEDFKKLVETRKLCATFVKCHKASERLNCHIFPIDLMFVSDSDKIENITNFLSVPQLTEEVSKLVDLNDQGFYSSAAEVEQNGYSDRGLNTTKEKNDLKSKTRTRSLKTMINEFNLNLK